MKEDSEKAGINSTLKKNIMGHHFMQIEGEKVEAVTDFLFLGSKITVDTDCIHEIRKCLLLGRKTMTNLHSILKSKDHFANRRPSSQSWTIKKAEHRRMDAFK